MFQCSDNTKFFTLEDAEQHQEFVDFKDVLDSLNASENIEFNSYNSVSVHSLAEFLLENKSKIRKFLD